jgi:phosphoribosylamine-glycine ligase
MSAEMTKSSSNGGRVPGVTALGKVTQSAQVAAYAAWKKIIR